MELLKGIKNIIFDLGGVVINLDYKLTLNEFKSLGFTDIEKVYTQFSQLHWFDSYDRGGISSEQFVAGFREYLGPGVNDEEIIRAWNAMLLDFPPERAELLLELKSRYRTFLLSNTNDIHIKYYNGRIRKEYGYEGLEQFFEKDYYSHIVGMRKPDKEIFEFVLRENGLKASETLFIDDSPQHVEGAGKTGIRAYHLQAPETIVSLFRDSR